MRILKGHGRLVLVGTAGVVKKIDLSRLWFKALNIRGNAMFSHIDIEGKSARTYQAAMDFLSSGRLKSRGWLTHVFPIEDYRAAIETALDKKKYQSMKVAFAFKP